MAIVLVEQLDDRIPADPHYQNGMHIPNEYLTIELPYADFASLRSPPGFPADDESGPYDGYWREQAQVSATGKSFEYQFNEWQETVSSKMQWLDRGSYLVP